MDPPALKEAERFVKRELKRVAGAGYKALTDRADANDVDQHQFRKDGALVEVLIAYYWVHKGNNRHFVCVEGSITNLSTRSPWESRFYVFREGEGDGGYSLPSNALIPCGRVLDYFPAALAKR